MRYIQHIDDHILRATSYRIGHRCAARQTLNNARPYVTLEHRVSGERSIWLVRARPQYETECFQLLTGAWLIRYADVIKNRPVIVRPPFAGHPASRHMPCASLADYKTDPPAEDWLSTPIGLC